MSKKVVTDVDELHDKLRRVDCLLQAIEDSAMRGDDTANEHNAKCFGEILVFTELAKREAAI